MYRCENCNNVSENYVSTCVKCKSDNILKYKEIQFDRFVEIFIHEVPEENWNIKTRGALHICNLCGCEFKAYNNKYGFYVCYKHKLMTLCKNHCGQSINIGVPMNMFCSLSCSSKFNARGNVKAGNCKRCGKFVEKRNGTGLCYECSLELSDKMLSITLNRIGTLYECSRCHEVKIITSNAGMCKDCVKEQTSQIWKDSDKEKKIKMLKNLELNKPLVWSNVSKENQKIMLNNLTHGEFTLKEIEELNNVDLKVESLDGFQDTKGLIGITGAIGLFGTFKCDNKEYALTAGKSNNIGNEIRRFWKIIQQPEKQIPYNDERDELFKDYGRWYDITHNYCNFRIVIIIKGCDDLETLKYEAAWALQNKALFQYDENHKKIEGTHGYWLR